MCFMSLDRHGEERTWIGTKKEKDSRPGMNDERVLPVATDQSLLVHGASLPSIESETAGAPRFTLQTLLIVWTSRCHEL